MRVAHALASTLLLSCAMLLAPAVAAPPQAASAELKVLDRYVGTWDVTVRARRPKTAVLTFTETYQWDLGGHFLHGDSGIKSDGTRDLVIATYDEPGKGYPFWIFSSSGVWYYLAPGRWDEDSRTLTWQNPPSQPLSYLTRCSFPDRNTRHCEAVIKDWKGTVLLDQKATAIRRR